MGLTNFRKSMQTKLKKLNRQTKARKFFMLDNEGKPISHEEYEENSKRIIESLKKKKDSLIEKDDVLRDSLMMEGGIREKIQENDLTQVVEEKQNESEDGFFEEKSIEEGDEGVNQT